MAQSDQKQQQQPGGGVKNAPMPLSRAQRYAIAQEIRERRDAEDREKLEQGFERKDYDHIQPHPKPAKIKILKAKIKKEKEKQQKEKQQTERPAREQKPPSSAKGESSPPKSGESKPPAKQKPVKEAKKPPQDDKKSTQPAKGSLVRSNSRVRDQFGYCEEAPPKDPMSIYGSAYNPYGAGEFTDGDPAGPLEHREDKAMPPHARGTYYNLNREGAWFAPEIPARDWKERDQALARGDWCPPPESVGPREESKKKEELKKQKQKEKANFYKSDHGIVVEPEEGGVVVESL